AMVRDEPEGGNTPVGTILENLSWAKGRHNFSFGGDFSEIRFHGFLNAGRVVQTANIGLSTGGVDPASTAFGNTTTSIQFPGINATNLTAVQQLFGVLTGRLTSYTGTISVNPATKQYVAGASNLQAGKQHQFGFYGSDSWRMRPNLTVTYGLRWDYQGSPYDTLNESFSLANGFAD